MSKRDIGMVWQIRLRQELIVPPLMMQAENVGGFVVAFLKGERSLYVIDVGDAVNNGMVNYGTILTHRQKI